MWVFTYIIVFVRNLDKTTAEFDVEDSSGTVETEAADNDDKTETVM